MDNKKKVQRFLEGPAQDGGIEIFEDEVFDRRLGIWWKKLAENEGEGYELRFDWSLALAHAWHQAASDEYGRNWRLPTVEESSSLVNIDEKGEIAYAQWLQDDFSWGGTFWTSTPLADSSDNSWAVVFSRGAINYICPRSSVNFVRLVRGVSRSVI